MFTLSSLLFGNKDEFWGSSIFQMSTNGQQVVKKVVKKGCLLGVTDSIPIHEYNHYHEYSGSYGIQNMNSLVAIVF